MINKKITAVVLAILLLCISLIGCSSNNEEATTTIQATTLATTVTTTNFKKISTTIPSTTTTTTSTTTTKEASTIKASTTKKNAETSTKNAKKSTTIQQTSTSVTQSQKYDVCYVSIECSEINNHIDSLKAGHSKYVPNDGQILNNYTVKIDENDTAYDAIVKACNDNEINLTSTSTQYGKYIVGINNLDEKDCGAYSGWLYYVNGNKPSVSTSKCTIKNGDKIVLSYTCGE